MNDLPSDAQLSQMITGCIGTQAVYMAAKLGVADLLAQGEKSLEHLAQRTKANPDALYRLLRTLSSAGVFTETRPRHFALTPMADALKSDGPHSQRDFALMVGDFMFKALNAFDHSIMTGKPAFDHVFGEPLFQYLSTRPEDGRVFDGAMTGIHGPETQPMIAAYDFSGFKTIVDVGGGNASTLLEVLRANPDLSGIVFDLPGVIERTRSAISQAGMNDRCRAEEGDFFKGVPDGADAYILRHIIHDWQDEESVTILHRCCEAAAPNAKLLVVESVIPAGDTPHPGKWLDLIMLSIPGGRERTAEEYEALFARAGWKLNRIVPTASPVSVIEGVRAS